MKLSRFVLCVGRHFKIHNATLDNPINGSSFLKDTEELAATLNIPGRRALNAGTSEECVLSSLGSKKKGSFVRFLPSRHTHHFIWRSHDVIKFNWVEQWKTTVLTT